MSNATFLKQALEQAREAAAVGAPIHPPAAAAHAANESGYGRSQLSVNANNFFGIKAMGRTNEYWDGSTVSMPTWEVVNGQNVQTVATFRKYKTWELCFLDYGGIISRVYPNAVAGRNEGVTFLAGLFLTGPSKWATDPAAFDKCARILGTNGDVLYADYQASATGMELRGLTLLDRYRVFARGKEGAVLDGDFRLEASGSRLVVTRES